MGLGLGGIYFVVSYSSRQDGVVRSFIENAWDSFALSKEQKNFKTCYKKKENELENDWLWQTSFDPRLKANKYKSAYFTHRCEEEGYKAYGRYFKEYQAAQKDAMKLLEE